MGRSGLSVLGLQRTFRGGRVVLGSSRTCASQLNRAPRCQLIMLTLGFSAQPLNRCARSWLPVLLAALARRSCSPFLLVALLAAAGSSSVCVGRARRSCSRWIFQRLRWSSSPQALPPTFCPELASPRFVHSSPAPPRLQNRFQPRSSRHPHRLQPCRQHLALLSSLVSRIVPKLA